MLDAPDSILDEWADTYAPMDISDAPGLKLKLKPPKTEKKKKNKTFRFTAKNAFLTYSASSLTPDTIWDELCHRATVAKPLRYFTLIFAPMTSSVTSPLVLQWDDF